MLTRKRMAIIAIALLITLGMNFLITPAAYAAADKFYYIGTTEASYSVEKGLISKIVDALGEIFDYILGLLMFGGRVVIVGWIALFEWVLVIVVDAVCGTDLQSVGADVSDKMDNINVFESIHNTKNRITFEKIIFNKIDLFNANIFDFEGNSASQPATP